LLSAGYSADKADFRASCLVDLHYWS